MNQNIIINNKNKSNIKKLFYGWYVDNSFDLVKDSTLIYIGK